MMKKLAKVAVVVLALVLAVPVLQYRTVRPCTMLRKELVKRTKETAEEVGKRAKEEASQLSGDAARIADGIGEMVEDVAEEVAEGVAEARVRDMPVWKCVSEFWRLKVTDRR